MGLSWVPRTTLGFPFSHCIVRFGSHDSNICKCTDSFYFTQISLVTRKTSYPWLFNLLTLALLQGFSPVVINLKQRHLSHNSRQSKSKLQHVPIQCNSRGHYTESNQIMFFTKAKGVFQWQSAKQYYWLVVKLSLYSIAPYQKSVAFLPLTLIA